MNFYFHPEAEQEYEAAKIFYEHHAGQKIAQAFVIEVQRVARMLADNPHYGKAKDLGMRSFALRRFPYSLVYQITAQGILVAAVSHQHREPNYWKNRA